MPHRVSRRTALIGGLSAAAGAGGLYTAGTALAGTGLTASGAGSRAWVQRWAPKPAVDKLRAFGGVEDDRKHSDPGVRHIFADPTQYRFVMHLKDRDGSDRQRQEVRGIRTPAGEQDMHKGETWRYDYQMYIPDTLKGTDQNNSFTHIFQVKHVAVADPVVTMDLARSGSTEFIQMSMYGGGRGTLGRAGLAPLRNKWIDVEIEITVADGNKGHLRYRIQSGGNTVVEASRNGDTWLGGNEAHPKWGIYRSIHDRAQLHDTYLLLRNMKAYQNK